MVQEENYSKFYVYDRQVKEARKFKEQQGIRAEPVI